MLNQVIPHQTKINQKILNLLIENPNNEFTKKNSVLN